MDLHKKIEILSKQQAFGMRKLTKVGNSFALLVPKSWLDFNCTEIDGEYYFTLQVEGNQLIFSPVDLEVVDAVTIREKVK